MMKPLAIAVLIFAFLSGTPATADGRTKQLAAGQTSPAATLADASWIAGHWRGQAFGGETEELWSPPLGDSMMGAFKLAVEGQTQFYELEVIRELEGTLLLQLRHFHGNLKGWEEKDDTVDFRLVEVTDSALYFEGFTIERVSDNEMHMYVVIENDGMMEEVQFIYFRAE